MASLSSPGSEDDISVRPAGKAGTWYIGNPTRLGQQLYGFLLDVPDAIEGQHLPVPGARIVIAPFVLILPRPNEVYVKQC